jgi:hypothetical protein
MSAFCGAQQHSRPSQLLAELALRSLDLTPVPLRKAVG